MRWTRRVKRTRHGTFHLRLPKEERRILASLPSQLRQLLDDRDHDPSVNRLFPPAYADDAVRDAEYQVLMGDELVSRRLASLDVVESTVEADELTEEQLHAWMSVLNDVRLVLGTRLDVTEDMHEVADDDPRAPMFALYSYLSFLLDQIVDALSEALPDAG